MQLTEPLECHVIEMMDWFANEDELKQWAGPGFRHPFDLSSFTEDLKIKVIMTMTHSGSTARMISSYRPQSSIYALTPFSKIIRQLQLVWGVQSMKVDNYDNVDNIPELCNKILKQIKVIDLNEQFVVTGGVPMGIAGTTNYLSIQIYK